MINSSFIKYITFLFFMMPICFLSAQNINQFDANGKRHGVWQKKFDKTNLLRYQGAFNHGKEIDTFKFYKKVNGKSSLAATKIFNKLNNTALVKFYSSRGKLISEGKLDGKKYIGIWKFYQKNSKNLLIKEHYNQQGVLDGERYVYYKNGAIAEKQYYSNGKLNGESFWYSEAGVVLKHFIYENDQLHGVSKYYSPKGDLEVQGSYKKGKKHGIWKYYKNNTLIEEKDFSYKPKKKTVKK